jgi:hypothetical protein
MEPADMSDPAQLSPNLVQALRDFSVWTEKSKEKYKAQIDQPVFHYTDANGLIGILSSNTLWFTDIRYLNDPSEFHFGQEFALKALGRMAKEHASGDQLVRVFCEKMLSGLNEARQTFSMFVGSFSKNGDELGQWRAYSDDGKGFCLGISPSVFTPAELQEDPLKNAVFIVISYNAAQAETEQTGGVEQAVEMLKQSKVRGVLNKTPGFRKVFLQQLSVELAKWIYFVSVGFKHPAYQTEQEIRLLLINETETLQPYVRIRARNGVLVPYIPWPFAPSLRQEGTITVIRVGPAAPPSAEGALHALLNGQGISPARVKISKSTIPYRGT